MKKIPKYKSLRIFIVSGLFYFFLLMPFMGMMLIQNIPEYLEKGILSPDREEQVGPITIRPDGPIMKRAKQDTLAQIIDSTLTTDEIELANKIDGFANKIENLVKADSIQSAQIISIDTSNKSGNKITINDTFTLSDSTTDINRPIYFNRSFDIFYYGILIGFILTFLISYPFRRYFSRKRKMKEISTRLDFFCRRYLLYTPIFHATIFGLVMLSTVGYIAYINFFVDFSDSINAGIFDEYLYIAALSGFLSTIFVYYWHKHRVHIFYLEVLFYEDELRKRIFRNSIGKIRNRLWLASGMTTLLPLAIVIFYLILSVTKVQDANIDLANDQVRNVILGNYTQLLEDSKIDDFFYVNSVNAYMMFVGIGISIFISLVYILTFVRWTTLDIVFPVKELLGNMQKTGEGKNTNFSVVRTNDEIGELAEGFNLMSQRIKNYIDDISEINNSYYRFVPKQFLDFLDKKSITDIHLGDQVQKEMTVMFSDIRSFTEISENMTPRDNFNFINHYLGYMEPIISRNHGFIDKYIGDAIMALFPESPDDALNAAIEMRAKLQEFNEDLKLNGQAPINSGIGMNTGNLMLGIVGGKGRIEGTVISDHVNLASRLEGLTKKYGASIIISQEMLIKLDNPANYQFRFLDMVTVKGKRNSVNIFEILDGEPHQVRIAKIATNALFKDGLQHYRNKEMDKALEVFLKIEKESPEDMTTKLYISRCQNFIEQGLPENWDGTQSFSEK
ncbi:adenylate/guanylate cyclase domain-containing protein [Lentimicrobium sp. L6]|uniref:adenylate/guanylate cyclase domain-containing protein n=1 Tax=Lentimicrobium sp. L6 TaxID=2735916 RepID=UPI0015572EEF|nr:adenylate/guanylate cyclase domain-containing protein [Lentimicrobium sp. L6]NPD84287.1 adenylate/guanylate cyclase domain-containing protein [Lentimicrobium sp. L6]